MNRVIKVRGFSKELNKWICGIGIFDCKGDFILNVEFSSESSLPNFTSLRVEKESIGQFIGLTDKNENEYYHGSIGEFDNGDRFFIDCEDWLEFFVNPIGEPECEDQWRDLYRISNAKIIGNVYQNPELLEA